MSSLRTIQFPADVRPWAGKLKWHDTIDDKDLEANASGTVQVQMTLVSDLFPNPANPTQKLRKRFLYVDLNNSAIGVGAGPAYNSDHTRGPYIHRLACQAWVQRRGAGHDPKSAVPGLVRTKDVPQTENASGSISSSFSYSISGSAGFFGQTPTGGVSGGISVGESYSHEVKDFTFYNRSEGGLLYHILEMTAAGDGHTYKTPGDLANALQSPFVGARLRPLPALAVSNLPLVGQAIWMNQDDGALAEADLELMVSVRPSFGYCHGKASFAVLERCALDLVFEPSYFSFPFRFDAADR